MRTLLAISWKSNLAEIYSLARYQSPARQCFLSDRLFLFLFFFFFFLLQRRSLVVSGEGRENWNSRSFAKWVRLGRARVGNYKPWASRVGTTLKLLTSFRLTRHLWRHEISRSFLLLLLPPLLHHRRALLLCFDRFSKIARGRYGNPHARARASGRRNEDILGRAISLNFAGRGKQRHLTWRKS